MGKEGSGHVYLRFVPGFIHPPVVPLHPNGNKTHSTHVQAKLSFLCIVYTLNDTTQIKHNMTFNCVNEDYTNCVNLIIRIFPEKLIFNETGTYKI